jgi:hypothetical protein
MHIAKTTQSGSFEMIALIVLSPFLRLQPDAQPPMTSERCQSTAPNPAKIL